MAQFHETGYGRKFFEGQMPDLIDALERIAKAGERIATQLEKSSAKPDEINGWFCGGCGQPDNTGEACSHCGSIPKDDDNRALAAELAKLSQPSGRFYARENPGSSLFGGWDVLKRPLPGHSGEQIMAQGMTEAEARATANALNALPDPELVAELEKVGKPDLGKPGSPDGRHRRKAAREISRTKK